MSAFPRIARVHHTTKVPDACPYRRGIRKKKLEIVQLRRRSSCNRVFTSGRAALCNKTYLLRTILAALTNYYLSYSVETTAARLRKKRVDTCPLRHLLRGCMSGKAAPS